MKILHIEDNPGDIMLTRELLQEEGFEGEVRSVKDGALALKVLHDESDPDIIVLDLNIPKKDGRELLAEIKSNERTGHIPVLIFSSSKSEKDIDECYALKANSYIVKPKDLDEFSKVIHSIYAFWLKIVELPKSI